MYSFAALFWMSIVSTQQLNSPEDILNLLSRTSETLMQSEGVIRQIPETSKLEEMYNRNVNRLNEIKNVESGRAGIHMQDFRKSEQKLEETEYLVKRCKEAFQEDEPDWGTLRRCFWIAEAGYNDDKLIAFANSLISFKEVETQDISAEQIEATLAALTLLARLDWDGRINLMEQCAHGALWRDIDIHSLIRPDLKDLLQTRSILNLAALPIEMSEPIIMSLQLQYPPSKYLEQAPDASFALTVAIVKADIERQKKGLLPILEGIR